MLRLKSAVIASPLEPLAKSLQWAMGTGHRLRHPEMWELWNEGRLLPLVLKRQLTPSSNVLDVGCHIGSFLSLALKCAPHGQHTAIEAVPTKAEWLRRKFPSVRIEQVAVADRDGSATFEEDLDRPGYSRLMASLPSNGNVKHYPVRLATLDNLALPSRIDLVKMDIEGGELAALKGGEEFFKTRRPLLIFECGAEANPGMDRRALFDQLQTMGYQIHTFADFHFSKGPLGFDEFRKCGIYPFRAFNFIATR